MMRGPSFRPRQFLRREDGAGTVLGLFVFLSLAGLLGIMLDGTNGWRNRTLLSSVADMGAHAGAVAIAQGKTEDEVREAVRKVVEANLPRRFFGSVVDTTTDVSFAYYDPHDFRFENGTETNAVVVRLERTRERGNPVDTFILRLIGVSGLDATAASAAVFDINAKCNATDGIYARDKVTLTSQTTVGAGFCIHSGAQVWLPQQNTFEEGSYISMPNLALCEDKCTDEANPGVVAVESHVVLPDIGDWILETYATFRHGGSTHPTVEEFFDSASLGDLKPLIDAGIVTEAQADLMRKGMLVQLTQSQFHAMPVLPSGLIYEVKCTAGGSGTKTWLNFSATSGRMEDVVLLTNCGLDFGDGSRVIGSIVVTDRISPNATVKSGSSVVVADPDRGCDRDDRTIFMSMSKVSVPAEFVMSNVTLIVDGDVDIASASNGAMASQGFGIHASGRVAISAQHTFSSCGGMGFLTPEGKVLRLVTPPDGAM